jgi:sugar/nucleoside kinase (ribokinase family)
VGPVGVFVGRSTLDLVYGCARLPDPDGKVDADWSYLAAGGPALNAAIAFAGLGGAARLCSPLGEGPLADWVRGDLDRYGVGVFDPAAGQPSTLPASCVIETGPLRAIVNQPLPPRAPAPAPAGPLLDRLFAARPAIVLSDGHLPELAVPVLKLARAAGAPTVLDGGSWKPWTAELLPWIDIAIVSSRLHPPGVGDALDWLAGQVAAAAVTDGPRPIRWRAGAASGEIRPPEVEAVDTLGAGDIFHGAFCHAFATGGDLAASLALAAGTASRACTVRGPRLPPQPSR